MSFDNFAIEVKNLSKRYEIYKQPADRLKQFVWPKIKGLLNQSSKQFFKEFWALSDVSFEVKKGETVGIIGKNGSGKSTLLQLICGTLTPTYGEVKTSGRIAALLELGSGFNPEFTGRENVYLNGAVLGLSKSEINDYFSAIEAFADIGDFMDQPVKTYSSGMYVRLAFAVQVHVDASIVIIDEALAVGDIFFQQKCFARLEELKKSGVAILFVSHAMPTVEQFCDRAVFLDHGKTIFIGSAVEATKIYYLHNQTSANVNVNVNLLENGISFGDKVNQSFDTNENNLDFWSNHELFYDLSKINQISNGQSKLLRFTICNERDEVCNHFSQGQTATFYYEFLVSEIIEVPLVGIVIQNSRGINVHGKGSLEYYLDLPKLVQAGTLIRCRQSIQLALEVGEYTFELGLATIDSITYGSCNEMLNEELFSKIIRLCHVPKAGVISIGNRSFSSNGPRLSHHGVADLFGSCQINLIEN